MVTLTFVAVLVSVLLLDVLVIRPWEARRTPARPADADSELEFAVPRGVFFHPGHVWARFDNDGGVTVGIDDLVRTVVGNLSTVELPAVGEHLTAGQPAMVIRHGERRLRLVVPLSGTVTKSNQAFGSDPVRLRWRPYKEGWTYRLDPETGATREIASLKIGKDAAAWMAGELDRLHRLFDDGTFEPPVEGTLMRAGDASWSAFEEGFLVASKWNGGEVSR